MMGGVGKCKWWRMGAALAAALVLAARAQALGPDSNRPEPLGSLDAAKAAETAPQERSEPVPVEARGVTVTEHLGDTLPLDLTFTDEQGRPVRLGDYFADGKPVILDLGYYSCPMLCGLVIHGLCDALEDLSFTPGDQFQVVNVSIDPAEKSALAMAKKRQVIDNLGNPAAAAGWHFLTGDKEAIQKLADAAGFGFRWDPVNQQFIHTAVLVVVTPRGQVSRYLYGVQYPAQTLRLSLVEAAGGKIGSPVDQLLLYCFHYDPKAGKYNVAAMNLMRLGGVAAVLVLAGAIGMALWREHRQPRNG